MRSRLGSALVAVVAFALAAGVLAFDRHVRAETAPVQPVLFSHAIHAGVLQTDCLFCHRDADKGDNASIPALQQCMFCHQVISQSTVAAQGMDSRATQESLDKIRAAWQADLDEFQKRRAKYLLY